MKPSGTSSFDDDDDDDGVPATRVEPIDALPREKPIKARRAAAMERTEKIYPQAEDTVFPRELLVFAIDAAREGYVQTANMGAAFNIMKRQVKDRWTVEKGPSGYMFKEHVHPLEAYLRPSAQHERANKPAPPMPREKPAAPEAETVADARKRWDAAKASGDAGAMTRAANDLLRAVEADRGLQGEAAAVGETARHSTSEILAPEEARRESSSKSEGLAGEAGAVAGEVARVAADAIGLRDASAHEMAREADSDVHGSPEASSAVEQARDSIGLEVTGDLGSGLAGQFSDEHLRTAANIVADRPDGERGELLRAFEERFGDDASATLAEHLKSTSESSERFVSHIVDSEAGDVAKLRYDNRSRPGDDYPAPERPGVGMDRVNRAERRGRRRKKAPPGQRHWVDPEVGWEETNARETLSAAAGKPLTVEALFVWSHESYLEDRGGVSPSRRIPDGWEFVAELDDENSGYYALAVRDKKTGTIVIINRGTSFDELADLSTNKDVFAGQDTRQFVQAREFLVRVYEMDRRAGKSGKIVVTGHSLGSACAQVQIAAAHYDDRLRGRVDISGVGFSSLGAKDSIAAIQRADPRWRRGDPKGFDAFVQGRFVSYTRRGDGIVANRPGAGGTGKPDSIGDTVWLDGIDEDTLSGLETIDGYYPNILPAAGRAGLKGAIGLHYLENHRMRSMYHPDFLDSLDTVLKRPRPGRRRPVH
jgi:hypothetical protein